MVVKEYLKDGKDDKLASKMADIAEKVMSMGLDWKVKRMHSGEGDIPFSEFHIGYRKHKWWPFGLFNFVTVIEFEIDWVWREIKCHNKKYLGLAKWIEKKIGADYKGRT